MTENELDQRPVWTQIGPYRVTSELFLDLVYTEICNANCPFCIARTKAYARPDLEKWKETLGRTLSLFNIRNVIILGGEATVDPDFFSKTGYLGKLLEKNSHLQNVILTTNGIRLRDRTFLQQLQNSCITSVNLSCMHYEKEENDRIFAADTLSREEIRDLYAALKSSGQTMRINANVYRGNLDSVREMHAFVRTFSGNCDVIKFSPLMETTMFRTLDSVTEFTLQHEIGKEEIRELFDAYACECTMQKSACGVLGFVDYKEVTDQAQDVILKYGQVEDQYDRGLMIPTLKLYPNGNLSNAWDQSDNILKNVNNSR